MDRESGAQAYAEFAENDYVGDQDPSLRDNQPGAIFGTQRGICRVMNTRFVGLPCARRRFASVIAWCESHGVVSGAALGGVVALVLLTLACGDAQAHDVSAQETARLRSFVQGIVGSGWTGAVLLAVSAVALGALHGLEPGHSKTMMSAFIIAVRGTVRQAVLLGTAATLSHTAVIWVLVLPVVVYGGTLDLAHSEPYFQVGSAVLVILIAVWTAWRAWRGQGGALLAAAGHGHHHHDDHDHVHGGEARVIDTGHGVLRLDIFEDGVPPRFRVRALAGADPAARLAGTITLETARPDGKRDTFVFADRGDYLESIETIPEPHEFAARLRIGHGDHSHDYDLAFTEHDHGHDHGDDDGGVVPDDAHLDAHARAHADELRRRLAAGPVTNGQIILFGLSGGLLPCSAAITILLLCLQLQRPVLGLVLVGSFSLGLALTMIAAGALAALGARHIARRWSGLDGLARYATFASCAIILCIGVYMLVEGIGALA